MLTKTTRDSSRVFLVSMFIFVFQPHLCLAHALLSMSLGKYMYSAVQNTFELYLLLSLNTLTQQYPWELCSVLTCLTLAVFSDYLPVYEPTVKFVYSGYVMTAFVSSELRAHDFTSYARIF
jgi:hypothetical protein